MRWLGALYDGSQLENMLSRVLIGFCFLAFSYLCCAESVDLSHNTTSEYRLSSDVFASRKVINNKKRIEKSPNSGSYFVSNSFKFSVGPGGVSFALYMRGEGVYSGQSDVQFNKLMDPAGKVYDLLAGIQECSNALQYCSVLVPQKLLFNNLSEGEWKFNLVARQLEGVENIALSLVQRNDKTMGLGKVNATLPITVYVSTMVRKESYERIMDSLDKVSEVFSGIKIKTHLNGEFIKMNTSMTISSNFYDHSTRALVSQGSKDSVNLFFVPEILTSKNRVMHKGLSPGIPGTIGIKGNFNGILVSTEWLRENCGIECSEVDSSELAGIIIHEIGHFLGLYHTSEASGRKHDPLSDTSECTVKYHDYNFNGIVESDECKDSNNFMFWNNVTKKLLAKFSNQQAAVMRASPAVHLIADL